MANKWWIVVGRHLPDLTEWDQSGSLPALVWWSDLRRAQSRDDLGGHAPQHAEPGVGRLVELAAEGGREARPGLELGICGEHGGDPGSIAFFHRIGLDYVSCSPYRVPIARVAAAQAAIGMTES